MRPNILDRTIFGGLLIFTFTMTAVKADIAPIRPPPPPPSRTEKVSIRGIAMQQVYTYWRGRRWMTVINSCEASQPACAGKDLQGCFVVGADGSSIEGGDMDALMALNASAGQKQIKLMLDHCSLNEIELR